MLILEPGQQGPRDPICSTPARLPLSIRRTTSIDTTWPDGFSGDAVVDARARDLMRTESGDVVLSETQLSATIDATSRRLVRISTSVGGAWLSSLVGTSVGGGFRRAVDESWPNLSASRPPLYSLLDDLPGASLVSGYAMLRSGIDMGPADPAAFESRADLCAGWAGDGVMMVAIREKGKIPTPVGPPAPDLQAPDDPLSWHVLADLPPNATRRRRHLDVGSLTPGGDLFIDATFRDSHSGDHGDESTIHEYAVTACVRRDTRVLTEISAVPHVLPWKECPSAVDSAGRLVGQPLADLRNHVRQTLTGVSTCTHLNDTLRSLADADTLIEELDG